MEKNISYLDRASDDRGWLSSWFLTMDHKRIAILYMCTVLFWFLAAILLGFLLRLQLMMPDKGLLEAQSYNAVFTLHGVIMVFLVVIPGMPAIFGNFFLPLQLGAKDVFFPKINLLSYYLYALGGVFAIASLFSNGPPDTGWTFYVPFSVQSQTNVTLTVTAAFILGFSSLLTGLNFITTVHRLRAPGMGWFQIPLFSWSIYGTAWVQVLATPVLAITLLLIIMDRLFGVGLLDPALGGDPLMYQHLFWIYSHPAVYIMILPAMGVISEIMPAAARKSIFGYTAIVVATLGIASVGSLVWAHHMFTSGMSTAAIFAFSFLTFAVAIPSAIKVFNWVATLYRGSIVVTPAFVLALCFIFLFTFGGLMGLVLGAVGTNIHVHDTQFVVSHFHFVIFGGTIFGFIAAFHYWFPKMFGRMYKFRPAYIGTALLLIGFMCHYVPMAILGLRGMPRRYYTYLPQFQPLNLFAGFGAVLMVAGIFYMTYNLIMALRHGSPAPANPWGATTPEWQTPSPPPTHNFVTSPIVPAYPYDFSAISDKGECHDDGS